MWWWVTTVLAPLGNMNYCITNYRLCQRRRRAQRIEWNQFFSLSWRFSGAAGTVRIQCQAPLRRLCALCRRCSIRSTPWQNYSPAPLAASAIHSAG